MKILAWLIAISLTANFVLGGWWLNGHSASSKTPVAPVETAAASSISSSETISAAVAPVEFKNQATTNWKDIQTDDLKEFVRRLRAVGCPEGVIQDIIGGAMNRLFQSRLRAIWPERFQQQPFWKAQKRDAAENKKNRERFHRQRDIEKEKSDLLIALLGIDPEKELRKMEGQDDYQGSSNGQLDFLSESKRDAVQKYLDDFNDKMQDFYDRNQDVWDSQSRAEQKQLQDEEIQGLAQFLTPDEMRQYELRDSQLANQLSYDLQGLSLDENQYEAIYDIRKKYGDSIYNWSDADNPPDTVKQIEQNKKSMNAEISAALGPDLGKEYQRDQDYSYKQLATLASRGDLPEGTADKIYDDKDAAEQAVKQLQNDDTLTSQQKQTALQQIRAETENTIKQSLGEKNYKKYLRNGGWWINNLAPTPPPKHP